MTQFRPRVVACSLLILAALLAPGALLAERGSLPPPPPHIRTGPTPPPEVLQRDAQRPASVAAAPAEEFVLPVPKYYWRHGCAPTVVGMVAGYWDTLGYPDLIPGDARAQTDEVNQSIASGGRRSAPFPAEQAQHYEDYASPEDRAPDLLEDAVITAGRTPHPDNSIADFMRTSRSSEGHFYGWSGVSDIGPAWNQYVALKNPSYQPEYLEYYWDYWPTFTWEVLTREIDEGRPLVAIVDTNSDGEPEHAVTIVGYRENPREYACWDTWSYGLRWEDFAGVAPGTPWGIWSALTFKLALPPPVQPRQWLPYLEGAAPKPDGSSETRRVSCAGPPAAPTA